MANDLDKFNLGKLILECHYAAKCFGLISLKLNSLGKFHFSKAI